MSRLDDDGFSPEVTVVEDPDSTGHAQSLSVRVGPVWRGGKEEGPVIWVEYQAEHLRSAVLGPVLVDPVTWRELNHAVSRRLRRRRWRRSR